MTQEVHSYEYGGLGLRVRRLSEDQIAEYARLVDEHEAGNIDSNSVGAAMFSLCLVGDDGGPLLPTPETALTWMAVFSQRLHGWMIGKVIATNPDIEPLVMRAGLR